MKIFSTPSNFTRWRRALSDKVSLGFVPTMGALHEGHMSLFRRARRENKVLAASIFVNPTQFGPAEDFSRYPRPFARDLRRLKECGVQILFAPGPKSMYPPGYATTVSVRGLTETLCGAPTSRGPEHFAGVATVVAKLFNIVRPRRAYFGMKDFQQVRVIEQLVSDLNFGVQIVRCTTVREKDGLAMSSRNAYLSPMERSLAPRLYLALQQGRKLLTSSKRVRPMNLRRIIKSALSSHPLFKIDYIEVVNPTTLQPLKRIDGPILLALAVRLGKTRLIDNLLVN